MGEVKVSDTALWMALCRASDEALSKDPLAKHWVKPEHRPMHDAYLEEVSPTENLMMCLRNRFFLDQIGEFFQKRPNSTLINIAAGVTSYPYLLQENHAYAEVDVPAMVAAKQEKMKELVSRRIAPKRDVTSFVCDLNSESEIFSLRDEVKAWNKKRPCFILLEGILYYLTRNANDRVLNMVRDIQQPGDRLGLVTWKPDFPATEFFKRFVKFLEEKLGQFPGDYTFADNGYLATLAGYRKLSLKDNPMLVHEYAPLREAELSEPYADEQLWILERT